MRSMIHLLKDYQDYCEGRRDIDEEPADFEVWLERESDSEQ